MAVLNGSPIPIKVVLVGDSGTGKSSLARAYTGVELLDTHIDEGSPFCVLSKMTAVDGESCSVAVWDTSAGEEYDRLRPLSYSHVDLFLVCFSVVQPESYESARARWCREVEFHRRGAPVVLVGCMTDLRTNPSIRGFCDLALI